MHERYTKDMFKITRKIKEYYRDTKESGNTLMMTLLFTPLIFGMMGFTFDAGMAFYIKNSLQSELDNAAVNGAQQTMYGSSNAQVINYTKAKTILVSTYKKNRNNYPIVNCGGCKKGTPALSKVSATHLRVSVSESSPTLFLHLLGINKMDYKMQSEARLGSIKG